MAGNWTIEEASADLVSLLEAARAATQYTSWTVTIALACRSCAVAVLSRTCSTTRAHLNPKTSRTSDTPERPSTILIGRTALCPGWEVEGFWDCSIQVQSRHSGNSVRLDIRPSSFSGPLRSWGGASGSTHPIPIAKQAASDRERGSRTRVSKNGKVEASRHRR